LQGSRFGPALFVIPANAGIQKAQITTMVNPVQTFPDWIPAFAGMTGCGLSESDKNSSNGYREPGHRLEGRARWDSLKMASGAVLCVGVPLAAPPFRAVREQPPQGPYHFLAEFLVLRWFQMPVPTESSSVLDIALGNCYRADPSVVFILHFLLDVP